VKTELYCVSKYVDVDSELSFPCNGCNQIQSLILQNTKIAKYIFKFCDMS